MRISKQKLEFDHPKMGTKNTSNRFNECADKPIKLVGFSSLVDLCSPNFTNGSRKKELSAAFTQKNNHLKSSELRNIILRT